MLFDGIAYLECPACGASVDWVDLGKPVWCCPKCDYLVNQEVGETPHCARCQLWLVRRTPQERPAPRGQRAHVEPSRLRRVLGVIGDQLFLVVLLAFVLAPLLGAALDPALRGRLLGMAAGLVLLPLIMGVSVLAQAGGMVAAVRQLARDGAARVAHGFEHGAAKILERDGFRVASGLTHHGGLFELHIQGDAGRALTAAVRRATREAIRRIGRGERRLAYHPQCGTSLMVMALLAALIGVSAGVMGLLLHLRAGTLALAFVGYCLLMLGLARPLGLLVQRLWTVATEFRRARVLHVEPSGGDRGYVRYDVYVEAER